MNIGIFNWGDIYEEFATRLLKYKNEEPEERQSNVNYIHKL